MSSQVPYNSPGSESTSHGGAMDPNTVRLQRTQHASVSSPYPTNSPSATTSGNASHGGAMDPNQIRLHLAQAQQNPSPSTTAANISAQNCIAASPSQPSPPQVRGQQAQYGSSAHLVGTQSPPAGFTSPQSLQSPQSVGSPSYFPPQGVYQQPHPTQFQQSFQGHQMSSAPQVGCPSRIMKFS